MQTTDALWAFAVAAVVTMSWLLPAVQTDVSITTALEITREQMGFSIDETFAVLNGLTPLVCVGETLSERESGRTLEVVERQVERAVRHLAPEEAARMVISYEPVWAIGTGHAATPEQAQEVQAFIRKLLAISHGAPSAEALRVLYGGSVKPDNIGALMAQGDIDGALVGAACLQADSFLGIIHFPAA